MTDEGREAAAPNDGGPVATDAVRVAGERRRRKTERRQESARRALEKEVKRGIYPNGVDLLAMIGIMLVSALAAGVVGGMLTWLTRWDAGLVNAIAYFLQMGLAIALVFIQRRTRRAPGVTLNLRAGKVSAPLTAARTFSVAVSRTAQPVYRDGRMVHPDDGGIGSRHGGGFVPGAHSGGPV